MGNLSLAKEVGYPGRFLIAKMMAGDATGISHMAVGSLAAGIGAPYFNHRVGNSMEMIFKDDFVSVIIHNDAPVFNFTINGVPNARYFLETTVQATDKEINMFSTDPVLVSNRYNHIFLIPDTSAIIGIETVGIGKIQVVDTATADQPLLGTSVAYFGYIETADTFIRVVHSSGRMFDEFDRVVPTFQYVNDRPMAASVGTPTDTVPDPTPTLMVSAVFGPYGSIKDVKEVALVGNAGDDFLAFDVVAPAISLSVGQKLRVDWRIRF